MGTSACMLDYSTIVIGDKFGSISVIRLPKDTNEDTQVRFLDMMTHDESWRNQ